MDRTHLTALLEATMNALAAGIFLIGHDGRILFSNRIADSFAKAGDALRVVNGRLMATDRSAATTLQRLLEQPPVGTSARSDVHETIALPRAGGGGLVATVTLVSAPSQPCAANPLEAAMSVIVQDPALSLRMPGEAFAQLYCLTAAELRVALAMVPGARPQTAAEALGISSNTVKTHLQRIFEKTETSRQADLIALMLRTTPPVMA